MIKMRILVQQDGEIRSRVSNHFTPIVIMGGVSNKILLIYTILYISRIVSQTIYHSRDETVT